jgi:hypothetical protein
MKRKSVCRRTSPSYRRMWKPSWKPLPYLYLPIVDLFFPRTVQQLITGVRTLLAQVLSLQMQRWQTLRNIELSSRIKTIPLREFPQRNFL